MDKEEFLKLVDKRRRGEASAEEIAWIDKFYDGLQRRAVTPAWDGAREEVTRLAMWNQITAETYATTAKGKIPFIHTRAFRAAAAALLLIAAGLIITYYIKVYTSPAMMTVSTPADTRDSVMLPDGSRVILNTGSTITYPEAFDARDRRVLLSGEAFFEVQKDPQHPFIIQAGDITTTVLGTSFNVRAYPGHDTDVAVRTGKVAVAHHADCVILLSDEQAIWHVQGNTLEKSSVAIDKLIAWTEPEIAFDLVTFSEIMDRLARWYHVDFTIQKDKQDDCAIKITLHNKGLDPMLNELKNIIDFTYERQANGTIHVHYKGCLLQ